MKGLIAALTLIGAIATVASAASTPYAGIFEISQDGAGHLTKFDVVGMVDARTGSKKPQPMTFPKAYVDAARAYVQAHLKPGTPNHYFTYFTFDPNNPTDLGVDAAPKN